MIGKMLNSAGGRKFIFGLLVLLLSSAALGWNYITGEQWVRIIEIAVVSIPGTIALDGVGTAIANRKSNAGS